MRSPPQRLTDAFPGRFSARQAEGESTSVGFPAGPAELMPQHSSKRSQPRCCTRQPAGGGERTLGNAAHTQVTPILLRFDLKEKAVGGIIKRAESRAAEVWRERVGSAGLPRGQLKVSC